MIDTRQIVVGYALLDAVGPPCTFSLVDNLFLRGKKNSVTKSRPIMQYSNVLVTTDIDSFAPPPKSVYEPFEE